MMSTLMQVTQPKRNYYKLCTNLVTWHQLERHKHILLYLCMPSIETTHQHERLGRSKKACHMPGVATPLINEGVCQNI
jgi:hypothetical protein